ncbi:hypothetical protein V6Z11_A11G304900 [Gossypium hirsutum]
MNDQCFYGDLNVRESVRCRFWSAQGSFKLQLEPGNP